MSTNPNQEQTGLTAQRLAVAKEQLRRMAELGVDVSALVAALEAKEVALTAVKPTEEDRKWRKTTVPPTMEQHFKNGSPELFHPATMWPGMAYSLTPGQRKWFGEFTGMVVSRTVTVDWVECWEGTDHPRAVKVSSNVHVANDRRGKVQLTWVIENIARFHQQSQEFDVEVDKVSDKTGRKGAISDPTKVKVPTTRKSLEDMMREFGF